MYNDSFSGVDADVFVRVLRHIVCAYVLTVRHEEPNHYCPYFFFSEKTRWGRVSTNTASSEAG